MKLPLVCVGLIMMAVGALPLLIYVAIAKMNGDPNPNPVGPGMLFMFCFWPGVVVLGVGLLATVAKWLFGART